jgi:hypothetical protein
LRPLFLSLRSFSRSLPLFSIVCALFCKNTRGRGYLCESPCSLRLCVIVCRRFFTLLFSCSAAAGPNPKADPAYRSQNPREPRA